MSDENRGDNDLIDFNIQWDPDLLYPPFSPQDICYALNDLYSHDCDIVTIYNERRKTQAMTEQDLRRYITDITEQRQNYFAQRFPNQPNPLCDAFIMGEIHNDSNIYYQLYILLIFTRVMDDAIHQLSSRFNIPDNDVTNLYLRHNIVAEGYQLSRRLNAALVSVGVSVDQQIQVKRDFVQHMEQHFEQRQNAVIGNTVQVIPPEQTVEPVPVFNEGYNINRTALTPTYPIVDRYPRIQNIHSLTETRLRDIIIQVRDARNAYFNKHFPNQREFHEFITSGVVNNNLHFHPLYFLLIFVRVMDALIHELLRRRSSYIYNDIYIIDHIVEEGMQLTDRLNRLIPDIPEYIFDGNQEVMTNFVRRMAEHFERRRVSAGLNVPGHSQQRNIPGQSAPHVSTPYLASDIAIIEQQLSGLQLFPTDFIADHNLRPVHRIEDDFHNLQNINRKKDRDLRTFVKKLYKQRDIYFKSNPNIIQNETLYQYLGRLNTNVQNIPDETFYRLYYLMIFAVVLEQTLRTLTKPGQSGIKDFQGWQSSNWTTGLELALTLSRIIQRWSNEVRNARLVMAHFVQIMIILFRIRNIPRFYKK